jgi:hypothetical protein
MMARRSNMPTVMEETDKIVVDMHTSTFELANIIAMAKAGHAGADFALRSYAATLLDQGRWNELPMQVQGYAIWWLLR